MPTYAYVLGFLVVAGTVLFAVGYQIHLYLSAYHATEAYLRAKIFRAEEARLRWDITAAGSTPANVPVTDIRREAYREQLRATPITALDSYPGIGSATIQRLRAAGYETLGDVEDSDRLDAPGLGPSRMTDVRTAIRAELGLQDQAFVAGTTPHAQRAISEIVRLTAARDAALAASEATAKRAGVALERLKPYLAAAAAVTPWAYFWHDRRARGTPFSYDPILDEHLPASIHVPAPAASEIAPPMPTQTPLPVARRLAELAGDEPPVAAPSAAPQPARIPASVKSVATILLDVCQADGELTAAERAALRAGLAEFFQHDSVLVRYIDPAIEQLAGADLDTDAALRFARRLSAAERDLLVVCAGKVAAASGRADSPEFASYERLAETVVSKARRTPRRKAPPPLVAHVTPTPAPPAGLRVNDLLDDAFAAPAADTPVTPVVAGDKALRRTSCWMPPSGLIA